MKMLFEDARQFYTGEPLFCIGSLRKLTIAMHLLEGLDINNQPAGHSLRPLAAEFLDQIAGIVVGIKKFLELFRRLANLFQLLE